MAAFQDLDWSWLKETSQRLTESSFSAVKQLFEPGYTENLLGKTVTDAIRGLVGNEYLSTGAFLLICGSLLGPSHTALSNLQSRIWNAVSVSVTIEERDEVYQAVEEFLADISKHHEFNNLLATTIVGSNLQQRKIQSDGQTSSTVKYTPGYGSHSIHFKGKKIRIRKDTLEQHSPSNEPSFPFQRATHQISNKTIRLWTLSRSPTCLQELVDTAIKSFEKRHDGKIRIYQYISPHHRWSSTYYKEIRDLDSVVLPVGLKEDLIADIKRFSASSKLYQHQNIPYRRTYLFEGPPGTGKSSLVQALVTYFRMHICTINLSDPTLTEANLNSMMNTIPQNSVILIEDVDALASMSKYIRNGLSWHSILNCLDGVTSQEGTIVFMATNSVELLDAALLRPGRVDRRIPFNLADDFQIRQMFMNFFGQRQINQSTDDTSTATYGSIASFLGMKRKVSSISDESSHKMPKFSKNDLEFYSRCFANYIRPYTVSPAEIQAFFLSCRDDDIEVIAHKGNEFLEFIKSLRPSLSKSTNQPHPVDQLVVVTSQTTPLHLNVQDVTSPSIPRVTPTLPIYQQKATEEDFDPSSEEYEQDELSQEDTDSHRHDSESEEVIEEEALSMTDGSDENSEEEELATEDEETVDEEDEEQIVEMSKSTVKEPSDDNDDLENDEEIENRSEPCAEVEANVNITAETDVHGEKILEITPHFEVEVKATDISEAEPEKQSLTTGLPTASVSERIPPPDETDVIKEPLGELKEVVLDGNNTSTDNQDDSEGNRSDSEQSELDLTPTGKQVECMPFPSPKKQEKVVADVLKHKMSRGLSFMEATDLIFKEGIQGVEAAVINRVLGEKSVTPIKRAVNRKPSFHAKRASYKFNRRLKRERSKQKMISDENEWRDEKPDTKLKREEENTCLEPAVNKDLAGKARKKVHYDNDSPLRKFASSQKHTSLHKAANLPTRSGRKSLAKSPKRATANTDPEDSSEYDSGTERARKELDDFLQRKASTCNKGVKAEKK
ncbi:hypothetical protein K450DRAFT_210935 [Umbelopsis ramanniana AG]|uniref:AAA+ ATPase domain-containing protein n=1 Tax=Umbelopsis ramanniana AG TaxID=1314678 RepID=A0AAD5E881_UMBRA|nr:uncharacterized protein K450DRAFT_210935 [Umbelopsis ramanniana AG]KAI8578918.1 hypothetical protein K450DRAFT_210935 [Umbelopsis ramanniana AG]